MPAPFGSIKYIQWLKEGLIPSRMPVSNLIYWKTALIWPNWSAQ